MLGFRLKLHHRVGCSAGYTIEHIKGYPRKHAQIALHLWTLIGTILFGTMLMLGQAQEQPDSQETLGAELDLALVDRGLMAYQENYCGLCHTYNYATTQGVFGPPHNAMSVIAGARIADPKYSGDAQTGYEYIRESLLQPELYVVPGYTMARHRMPSYQHLAEEDIEALSYLLSRIP